MKMLDRFLQWWRIAEARPYIAKGARVLDVGCGDGALFRQIPGLGPSVGIDPVLASSRKHVECAVLLKGYFPDVLPAPEPFDAITLLAVLEHMPDEQLRNLSRNCSEHLKPGGYLLVTVPSPAVDVILSALKTLRMIDGMALGEHHCFDVHKTPACLEGHGLSLVRKKKFQLGLNNLFVFRKDA